MTGLINSHSNSIRIESAGGGIVLEATEEIIITNGIKLGIALETVDYTLSFN